ncbi:MAG: efflux RND transporter permease subunit [Mariprofundus sp.]|nr:efflux RND transporter permease subunit [Mariprofundus sp.]
MNWMLKFGLQHRVLLLLMLGVLTLAAAGGIQLLQVEAGIGSMVSKQNPDYLTYERVVDEFGSDQRTLVFVRDPALWTATKLAALKTLHERLLALDVVQGVEDIFTLRSLRGEQGRISSQLLIDHLPENQAEIDQLKKDILYNPLIKGNLVSATGEDLALMLSLNSKALQQMDHQQIYTAIQQVIEASNKDFERLFQIGSSRIQMEMEQTLFSDMRTLAPLSAAVLLLVILLFMRSAMAAFIPLLTASISLIWTLGMMGWLGIPVNILSAMLPTLIIVIGSTEDTHLIASFMAAKKQYPQRDVDFCVQHMLQKMTLPLLLTVLTTVLGFAGNIFSSMDMIRDFAIASSFAMLANGVITLLLVPVLLTLLDRRDLRQHSGVDESWFSNLVLKLNQQSNVLFQRVLLAATVLLCAFFLFEASKLYVSNDPMSYFKQDHALIQDANAVNAHLAGIKTFYITLESDTDQAFLRPKNLQKLADIETFIDRQAVFDRSISLVDYMKLLNREFHVGDEHWYQVPNDKGMVAQLLLFMHRQELKQYVSHDYRRAVIVVRHHISDSNILNRNVAELRQAAKEIAGADMGVFVVGENLMVNEQADMLLHAQIESLMIFLFIIFLLMSALFTSFKGGLIALVPSVIPVVLMFGVMGLLEIPLNPGTAMVAVIAIGIAIDSTIHMLSRYNVHSRNMGDAVLATQQAVRDEAFPMIATSVALALGFGMLLASDFAVIGQFGALAAATMLFALFANLVVTPLIMSRIRLVGLYDILALSIDKEALRDCKLFHGMSDYQIRKAMLISEVIDVEQGRKVIEQGSMDRCMYLLIEGEVDVVHHAKGGDETIARLKPGDIFGEIAFVHAMQRTADVCAVNAVSVVKFDCDRLKNDLRYFPRIVAKLNFNISYILGERLAGTLKD